MQLLVDPLVDAQSADLFDVGGPWAERQPSQNVYDLFVQSQLLVKTACSTRKASHGQGDQHGRGLGKSEALHTSFPSVSLYSLYPMVDLFQGEPCRSDLRQSASE